LARKGVLELTSGASRGIRLKMLPGMDDDHERSMGGSMVQIALSLPLVGRVAAGSPILSQEHIEASYSPDPKLFTDKPDYLLNVRGMSMRDAGILEGDLLAVRQAVEARNGQIVVARVDGGVTVKRFRRRGSTIELLPENPDFQPIIVDARSSDFALEGVGVGLVRTTKSL